MINAIGEATMQQFIRTNYSSGMVDKDMTIQKTDQVRRQRPVEKSDTDQKSEANLQGQENMTSRNSLENGQLVVEKYDQDGKLIRKIPPGYLPFGELV